VSADLEHEYLSVRPAWLERHKEDILEPALPIIDPHHHVWDAPNWRYLFDDFLADVRAGHNIRSTVYVQCYSMYRKGGPRELRSLGETEFANGVAAMAASGIYGETRICDGIVGMVDLFQGSRAAEILEKHITITGGRFKGIRQITAWHQEEAIQPPVKGRVAGMLLDPKFREGFATLAPLGLTFDAWAFHSQLDEVLDLARAFPGTMIALNHLGGPVGIGSYATQRQEVFAAWRGAIRKLAECPNIAVKIGGLGAKLAGFSFHRQAEPPSSEQLATEWRPYVEAAIETFGPARCMFESNFPVDKGSCSYAVIWNAFKRLAGGCSADEKTALFSDTAARFYRLEA
jgi:predicted TIM-barrel fold metal-dependent hydrolase